MKPVKVTAKRETAAERHLRRAVSFVRLYGNPEMQMFVQRVMKAQGRWRP